MPPAPKHSRRWFQISLGTTFLVVTIAAFLLVGYRHFNPVLVRIDSATFGDPNVAMKATEVFRESKFSCLEIEGGTHLSEEHGGYVFLIIEKAISDIAKARGTKYCVLLNVFPSANGRGTSYLVGFTNSKNAEIENEFGEVFRRNPFDPQEREYVSVEELDSISAKLLGRSSPADAKDSP
jgi:hypothetical protein